MFAKLLFSILIFFVPLSFACTEPWALFIFQLTLSVIFIYLLFNKHKFTFSVPAILVNVIFIYFIFISIIQLFNAHTILENKSIIPFTISPFNTLKELNNIFIFFMLFVISTQFFNRLEKIKKIIYLIISVSGLVLLIGLCFPNGEYTKFFLGTSSLGNFGPFTNRNNAGIFLSMAFFICLSCTIYNFYRYQKFLIENKKKEFCVIQTINISISLLLLLGIIVTRSRGAMLSMFISIFIFLSIYAYHFSKNIKKKILNISLICILFLISTFVIYKNIDNINSYSRRVTFGVSDQTRLYLYNMSFDILEDYPITGIGFASFPITIDKYIEKDLSASPEYLHNDWLELLLDIGYPLYFVFIVVIFILIYMFLKRIKFLSKRKKILFIGILSSICSICIGSLVDFHFHIPANAMLFIIFLSILSSISFYKDDKQIVLNNNLFIKILCCVMIFLLLYFSFKNMISWKYYTFSKNLPKIQEIQYLEKSIKFSGNPKYLENYIITLYNYSISNKYEIINNKENISNLCYEYLKKYPYDKKISKIYNKLC